MWDRWAPAIGDEIRVDYGSVGTGIMFVSSASPMNGTYDIVAQSAPPTGYEFQHKAWAKVRLLHLAEEIAKRNGLTFSSYGVTDAIYPYVLQEGESDLRFLHRRAMLEGCAVLIYDKRLILYSEAYMEAQKPTETIEVTMDGDYRYSDNRDQLYGSCVIEHGVFSGSYTVNTGSVRIYRPQEVGHVGSDAEATRFAKNLLRAKNKGCCGGYVRSRILPGYAAASTVTLSNVRAPSWDGTVFLEHVRNDYAAGKSKLFFRRPLEGY